MNCFVYFVANFVASAVDYSQSPACSISELQSCICIVL